MIFVSSEDFLFIKDEVEKLEYTINNKNYRFFIKSEYKSIVDKIFLNISQKFDDLLKNHKNLNNDNLFFMLLIEEMIINVNLEAKKQENINIQDVKSAIKSILIDIDSAI